MKIRLSKKFVLILGGGLLLCGASGAAAVLIGADRILGPSYRDLNGLSCTTLQTVKSKKDQRYWVRKYVTSNEAGDGMSRIRTALRVARAVQAKEKADLVQIAMVDKAGPKDRAAMRGRMIAAQVVYIPDLAKVPEGAAAVNYSAYYLDGAPTAKGEYFGMRVDLPLEDVEHLEAKLTDKADCIDLEPAEGAHPVTKSGHGVRKPAEHGEAAGGHGEAPAGHGEAPEHGETPVAEGQEAAPAEGHGEEVAAKESGGFLSSVTGMIFGSKEEPKAEHGAAKPTAGEHGAAAEAGHAAPDAKANASHDAPKTSEPAAEGHATAAETSDDHGEQAAKPAEAEKTADAAHAETAADAEKPAEEQGFLDQVKGMIFGGSSDKADGASHEEAKADAGHEAKQASEQAHEPAPEPRTSAEGGKRWSNSDEKDEIRSEDTAGHDTSEAKPEDEHAEAKADGPNEADAAGAAWLEKFRAQQAEPESEGADH
ncbi:hypothetical protein SAMN03159496_02308 [Rhizobium sp. NFR07]|uniref:hypothetical protein n=1 Tax=Rhizobium sp. NFR07 TaxID=1566262 RepID=UPI0008E3DF22|nr:hypothetical protein [Rhizobium sp. NFR07]SFB19837.1 hypothetical protein SAMN03159496_02308 [Rhizobium sp. NFR07]